MPTMVVARPGSLHGQPALGGPWSMPTMVVARPGSLHGQPALGGPWSMPKALGPASATAQPLGLTDTTVDRTGTAISNGLSSRAWSVSSRQ